MTFVCRFDDLLSWKKNAYCLVSKSFEIQNFSQGDDLAVVRHDGYITNTKHVNPGDYHSVINDARC